MTHHPHQRRSVTRAAGVAAAVAFTFSAPLPSKTVAQSPSAADEFLEEQGLARGLLARYSMAGQSVERVEERISADWGSSSPDIRFGHMNDSFQAVWKSKLLVQQGGEHRLHAYAQGNVRVTLGGETVLSATSESAEWLTGEAFVPDPGFQPIEVRFEKISSGAELHLYWSSESFPLEPLPEHLLFREGGRHELARIRQGRDQYEAFRCGKCHGTMRARRNGVGTNDVRDSGAAPGGRVSESESSRLAETGLPAPDLTRSVDGLSSAWIQRKVQGQVSGTMPGFGMTDDEAAAIAAALLQAAEDRDLHSLPKPARNRDEAKDRQAGLTLIRSLGCLACHSIDAPIDMRVAPPVDTPVDTPTDAEGESESQNKTSGNASPDGHPTSRRNLFGGGDLSAIGSKRSTEWLVTWLRNPQHLNREHRMPVYDLSSQEVRRLALALTSLRGEGTGRDDDRVETSDEPADPAQAPADALSDQVETGRRLIAEFGCRSCHRLGPFVQEDQNSPPPRPVQLIGGGPDSSHTGAAESRSGSGSGSDSDSSEPGATDSSGSGSATGSIDWSRSCAAQASTRDAKSRQPFFADVSAGAVRAYLSSLGTGPRPRTETELGQRLLTTRNCLACHPRGQVQGFADTAGVVAAADPDLRGQAPKLVPPSLTAVGDRLLDPVLAKAVSGEQKRRMDWKHVRMPKFRHSDAEREALVKYLISSDRIPDDTPTWNIPGDQEPVDDQTLLIGRELVGPKGFSCIACHQVGDYVPKKVEMGARGSNLVGLGNRMRHSYFIRWTRSPLRIVPGVEMPSYVKPVPGVLNEDVRTQLETLWRTLADPRFEPPTNPASVEQFIVVKPGAPARIIRDVFTHPEDQRGGYVARSFAVGFGNGHNVLFDLDRLALRRWTFGDFARQRTVGKSWYWDMAGSDVVKGLNATSNYRLVRSSADNEDALSAAICPKKQHGTVGRLLSYEPAGSGVRFQYRLNFEIDGGIQSVVVEETLAPGVKPDRQIDSRSNADSPDRSGWYRDVNVSSLPDGYQLVHNMTTGRPSLGQPIDIRASGGFEEFLPVEMDGNAKSPSLGLRLKNESGRSEFRIHYTAHLTRPLLKAVPIPPEKSVQKPIRSMPGFTGEQLPLSRKIMPTGMTALDDGSLAFTSLEGHVFLATDSDGDGFEDKLTMFEEGLAAPYGILQDGDSLLVSHKPEILRLRDTDGDRQADERTVFATGWGFNENYHDWTCGIVRDQQQNLYVGLGSDYAQRNRPKEFSRWRGKVLKVSPEGDIQPFSHAFRYPTGVAIDSDGNLFASDNQGVQNTFNEINHLRRGVHFGVPKMHEQSLEVTHHPPAIQVPHPWSRSVNGIMVLPDDYAVGELAGHGIGCEYEKRLLIRFTYHEVDGVVQGAAYYFSKPDFPAAEGNFQGPLSVTAEPDGTLYVGSIHDSGWLGGRNTGSIVKLNPTGTLPNGIREIRATPDGFEIRFFHPVDRDAAAEPDNYSISGYTRVWKGGYSTPDSGRFQPEIEAATASSDGKSVRLKTSPLKSGFVYDIHCRFEHEEKPLWPSTGHYTLHRIPD